MSAFNLIGISEGSHVGRQPPPHPRTGADIFLYTDGSINLSAREGGWAFTAQCGDGWMLRFGCEVETTGNRMEFTAILKALEFVKTTKRTIYLHTDSEYCKKSLTIWHSAWRKAGWITSTGTKVKNVDLIEAILARIKFLQSGGKRVHLRWIKGHRKEAKAEGHEDLLNIIQNNIVDDLAVTARKLRITNSA